MILTLVEGRVYSIASFDVLLYVVLTVSTFLFARSLFRRLRGRKLLSPDGKVAVITGCDTGFGKESALKLSQDGYIVFAGCLHADSTDLPKTCENLRPIQMDVTNQQQVDESVKVVEQFLSENKRLHLAAVVCNAGVSVYGYAEFVSMESFQTMVNINFLGAVRVFKGFLPLIRLNNKTGGRLVAVSSMAAHISSSNWSGYAATKAGLLAFMDCLRFEVERRFGISISTILPDLYFTEAIANVEQNYRALDKTLKQVEPKIFEAYGGEGCAQKSRKEIEKMHGMAKKDLSPVIDAISDAIGSPHPKRRYYPIEASTRFVSVLAFLCPSLCEWLIRCHTD